jgi:uncharacterized cupin superfamily protein
MRPAPIDPSWIIEGAPTARVAQLGRSRDGLTWTDLWDCTAGRFRWHYGPDETVHVIEGEAIVTDADGHVWTLRPGDVVTFRAGTKAQWHVPEYIRKVAFCRKRVPRWVAFGLGAWRACTYHSERIARRLKSRPIEVAVFLEVIAVF